ncbi:accessory factor UbiK family protein [Crenobacter cavernae]|uniref:Ubiquinone biosynthesis accessory factor UbiK n=1 Tax=Crenobacter cavernae TaxID=2290923 RepID=A0ABY0FBX3_9NEIS|nr:accessory factor UbiK family protein [Crenobacter cavernae]RXZ43575.1 accessory factor UbiK family protein [Crenobacter cavernae]
MLSQKLFEEISNKISETIAASPAKDVEKNIKSLMSSTFSRMDLVTREEFDVQQEVLARTREKLTLLEARVAKLEAALFPEAAAEQERSEASQGHS